MSNYSSMDGVLYCKPHFEQLFKEAGNYSKKFQSCEDPFFLNVLVNFNRNICLKNLNFFNLPISMFFLEKKVILDKKKCLYLFVYLHVSFNRKNYFYKKIM